MPEIKVKHNLKNADKPPPREPIPQGDFSALIVSVSTGLTQTKPPLEKFTVEYRLLKWLNKEDATEQEQFSGRRVYQDYVYEPSPTNDEMTKREAFRIRQLLDATGVQYTEQPPESGQFAFNSDHILNKSVKIRVSQQRGKTPDDEGVFPIYNRVNRVDTMEEVAAEDLV